MPAKILGRFEPGNSPVILNPLATGNKAPESTFNHETTHATLTQDTAFGIFFEMLCRLRDSEQISPLVQLAYEHQWKVQEGCANYVGLTTFAHDREMFDKALAELPSEAAGQPGYREVFDTIAAVVPIGVGASETRLAAHRYFVTAMGRLSMDNDCLVQFLDPSKADLQTLQTYLQSQSPNQRLTQVLESLKGRSEIAALFGQVETAVKADFHPTRVAMGGILDLIPNFKATSGVELQKQHGLFKEAWQPLVDHYAAKEPTPEEFGRTASIPALTVDPELTLTLEDVRKLFVNAKAKQLGLWVVIAFVDEDKLYLDLMPYELADLGNPAWTPFTLDAVKRVGFVSGEFRARDVIEIFDDFPTLPHAITFTSGAWYYWEQLTQGRQAGQKSIKVSMSRTLSEMSLQVMLAFRDMHLGAKYFLTSNILDEAVEKPYFAYFADPSKPGIYGIQYIPGSFALGLFRQIAATLRIKEFNSKALKTLNEKIPHFALLELMSIPALDLFGDEKTSE